MIWFWQSCPELLDVLKVGKFDELKQHLHSLVALYNIDGDKYVSHPMYKFALSVSGFW